MIFHLPSINRAGRVDRVERRSPPDKASASRPASFMEPSPIDVTTRNIIEYYPIDHFIRVRFVSRNMLEKSMFIPPDQTLLWLPRLKGEENDYNYTIL
jgi:hypothetical protein